MIKLEDFSEKHLQNTFDWMQNPNLKKSFLLDKEISEQTHADWFEQVRNDDEQKIFAIIFQDIHVGNVGLKNIDEKNRKAEIWIYIGNNNFRGKGLASKALIHLNEEFENHYQKFYAQIADFNIPSIKTFSNAGYRLEGILPQELIFQEKFVNIYRFYIVL